MARETGRRAENESPEPEGRSANQPGGRGEDQSSLRRVAAQADSSGPGFMASMREWFDALIIAFVLAMFIRTFVVELFKIPSGSMSPTLLGDWIAEGQAVDRTGQARQFLLIASRAQTAALSNEIQIYQKDARGHYRYMGKEFFPGMTPSQQALLRDKGRREEHRIFVNKMSYWFRPPDRGDIVVFKVPFEHEPSVHVRSDGVTTPVPPYNRNTAVYVKRAVAFGGEEVRITDDEHLYINGEPVTEPPVFERLQYSPPQYGMMGAGAGGMYLDEVAPGEVFMLGDNSDNSLDSRYWGGVPLANLRGKAFLRYWPMRKFKFLNTD